MTEVMNRFAFTDDDNLLDSIEIIDYIDMLVAQGGGFDVVVAQGTEQEKTFYVGSQKEAYDLGVVNTILDDPRFTEYVDRDPAFGGPYVVGDDAFYTEEEAIEMILSEKGMS